MEKLHTCLTLCLTMALATVVYSCSSGTIDTTVMPATMSLTYNGTGNPPCSGTIAFTFQN
jgi:hypothetical protein